MQPAGKAWDATLLAEARADSAARGRLLERYRGYLFVLARVQIGRRLRGKVDAEDLVQDAFLQAHRAFGQFAGDTEATFASWLRRILAGEVAHLVRRYFSLGRNVDLERDIAQELDSSSNQLDCTLAKQQSTPSEQALRREQTLKLADALEQLPADYRDVIVYRQLEELPFAEVAQRMERTVDSVQKLWVRAWIGCVLSWKLRIEHGQLRQ